MRRIGQLMGVSAVFVGGVLAGHRQAISGALTDAVRWGALALALGLVVASMVRSGTRLERLVLFAALIAVPIGLGNADLSELADDAYPGLLVGAGVLVLLFVGRQPIFVEKGRNPDVRIRCLLGRKYVRVKGGVTSIDVKAWFGAVDLDLRDAGFTPVLEVQSWLLRSQLGIITDSDTAVMERSPGRLVNRGSRLERLNARGQVEVVGVAIGSVVTRGPLDVRRPAGTGLPSRRW